MLARAVLEDVNPVGRGKDIDFAKLLAEERIQEGRFARLHFPDDDEEERLADVLEHILQRVEHGGLALHVGRQFEQRGKGRLRPAAQLQIKVGDHAGSLGAR